jgi:hypothetical protein
MASKAPTKKLAYMASFDGAEAWRDEVIDLEPGGLIGSLPELVAVVEIRSSVPATR